MKNSIVLLAFLFLIVSCKQDKPLKMEGAYSLTMQVLNDGTKDSSLDRGQLKLYTKTHFMYASPNLTDSLANFGVGQYKIEDGKIIEYGLYRSNDGGEVKDTLILAIEEKSGGYRQVIESIMVEGKSYKLTEEYDDVSDTAVTPLDGAWKQVKNIYTRAAGDSSVNNNPLEYKVYQSGHFIWGITAPDSLNKKVSVYGYGTFAMLGSNKTKETVRSSTFQTGLVGKTYEVDIELMGSDTYRQTITFANGDKSTEIYQRLK
jgi:hypothetical protein